MEIESKRPKYLGRHYHLDCAEEWCGQTPIQPAGATSVRDLIHSVEGGEMPPPLPNEYVSPFKMVGHDGPCFDTKLHPEH